MIIHLTANAIFWYNALLQPHGILPTISPWYLLAGQHIDYHCHVCTELGSYVQTQEPRDNSMGGLTGNAQGGHYFMSLATGHHIVCHHWTKMPMSSDVIEHITQMAIAQQMPDDLTFGDHCDNPLLNHIAKDDEATVSTTNTHSSHPPALSFHPPDDPFFYIWSLQE